MNIYNYDSNFNIIKEIEYNESNTDFIDNRIWKVCKDAENNYDQNQKTVKEIQKLKKFDIVYKDKKTYVNDNIKINNEFHIDSFKENTIVFNKPSDNINANEDSSYLDLEDTKKLFQSNGMNKVQKNKTSINKLEHKHRKAKKCVACELKKK
jgi:hypothetical protein